MASRDDAIAAAGRHYDDGDFVADLTRRVGFATESQEARGRPHLDRYLADEIAPCLAELGFDSQILPNPQPEAPPLLVAERHEDAALPTVLIYGHGDVVRGQETEWRDGLAPWTITQSGDRLYGRGVADNKGQHSVNIAALSTVLATRGRLGFNAKILLEMAEEVGSPGLRIFCEREKTRLAADLLLASDGPRLRPERPTVFMGARGSLNFDLTVALREGGHHSGNWGGLLANPAIILAHALASLTGPTGAIRVPALKPSRIPNSVRTALADIEVDGGADGPVIDPGWGEPGLSPAERVFGWNAFEILAMTAGNPKQPVNAIPPTASAHCQIRFTVDTDPADFMPAIRRHLDEQGFPMVTVTPAERGHFPATRLDPDHPWARWAIASVERTTGARPAVLPNLGGSLPNDCFADVLGLPTVWVPHSYAGCSQHAPNEHGLSSILRQGLQIMTGLFWDLGEVGANRPV
ncbi:MAG TPA: M20 family metallopeptidase [Stellaceae bacterium]|nr:M20 family metallopeptidase [Stellaceae bacterium]